MLPPHENWHYRCETAHLAWNSWVSAYMLFSRGKIFTFSSNAFFLALFYGFNFTSVKLDSPLSGMPRLSPCSCSSLLGHLCSYDSYFSSLSFCGVSSSSWSTQWAHIILHQDYHTHCLPPLPRPMSYRAHTGDSSSLKQFVTGQTFSHKKIL